MVKRKIILQIQFIILAGMLFMMHSICVAQNNTVESAIIQFNGTDLQSVIDSSPPYTTINCDRNIQLTISETIVIDKPLSLLNLNATLPDGLGKTAMIEVHSNDVTITDFQLRGNANTVEQSDRAPLIKIYRSNFRIERGLFENSSKDGVVVTPMADSESIDGGIVRNIVGRECVRDVVSISGTHKGKSLYVRNILVENIRGYDSARRGPVEVSDGAENITVRKVYAENCVYAIDWQDHHRETEINRNVVFDDIYALNCQSAFRSTVDDFGHTNLTITNIVAENCIRPVTIVNTSNVILQNVRIIGHSADENPVFVQNCSGLTMQNISIENSTSGREGVLLENCDKVLIDGVSLLSNTDSLSNAITYSISDDKVFENLRITNVSTHFGKPGIVLKKRNNATLKNYLIDGNVSPIIDQIQGENGRISNNIE